MMSNHKPLAPFSRRNFLKKSAFILPTIHLFLEACSESNFIADTQEIVHKILKIELLINSDKFEKQKEFYTKTLGLPLLTENSSSFEVMAGKSIVKFMIDDTAKNPIYHVAFNIPENQLEKAQSWSKKRFQLLKNDYGEEIIHFRKWDAHAIYFRDPAQNILEFIAHHSLKNSKKGDFTEKDIQFVGEIALVSQDVQKLSQEISQQLGMEDFISADKILNSPNFRALGDPRGMIILSRNNREWLMTNEFAKEFKVYIELNSSKNEMLTLSNGLYTVGLKGGLNSKY